MFDLKGIIPPLVTPFDEAGAIRYDAFDRNDAFLNPIIGYRLTIFNEVVPVFGPPVFVDGLRLVDSQASYGIGLQTHVLGFPLHFDWSWKTKFNKTYEDVLFFYNAMQVDPSGFSSGSDLFRKVRFSFWIGYDF